MHWQQHHAFHHEPSNACTLYLLTSDVSNKIWKVDIIVLWLFLYYQWKTLFIIWSNFHFVSIRLSAVDSFSNPEVLAVIVKLYGGIILNSSKQKSSFTPFWNPQIPGVLWHPQHSLYLHHWITAVLTHVNNPFKKGIDGWHRWFIAAWLLFSMASLASLLTYIDCKVHH